jgi:hypothetical protein
VRFKDTIYEMLKQVPLHYGISSAETSMLEAEIDCLVYQVYGLADDEIAIVERMAE